MSYCYSSHPWSCSPLWLWLLWHLPVRRLKIWRIASGGMLSRRYLSSGHHSWDYKPLLVSSSGSVSDPYFLHLSWEAVSACQLWLLACKSSTMYSNIESHVLGGLEIGCFDRLCISSWYNCMLYQLDMQSLSKCVCCTCIVCCYESRAKFSFLCLYMHTHALHLVRRQHAPMPASCQVITLATGR